MTVRLNPYLSFKDEAPEAKVMHSMLEAPNGLVLMGADTPSSVEYIAPQGLSISLSGDDDETLRGYWEALSASGTVFEPLAVAPWEDAFGMCVDRYGITWMVNIAGSQA